MYGAQSKMLSDTEGYNLSTGRERAVLLCGNPVSSQEPSKVGRGRLLEGSRRTDAFWNQEGSAEAGEGARGSGKGGGLHCSPTPRQVLSTTLSRHGEAKSYSVCKRL